MSGNKKPMLSLRKPPEPAALDRWVSGQGGDDEDSRPSAGPVAVEALRESTGAAAGSVAEGTEAAVVAVAVAAVAPAVVEAPAPVVAPRNEEPVAAPVALEPEPEPEPVAKAPRAAAASAPSAAKGRGGKKPGGGRVLLKRADGRELTRLQVYLEPALAKKLKRHCVDIDTDMTSYVRQLIENALKRL